MVSKVSAGGVGSSSGLAGYLELEVQGSWFNQTSEDIEVEKVINEIDSNKRNLGSDDMKYYHIIISPSEKELTHIKNDPEKLRDYARSAMENYAENFNKGIKSENLVWFGKVEQERHYNFRDKAVKLDEKEKGSQKEGLQTHIHIIVSRTENLNLYTEGKKSGEIERKNPLKLSPMTNHRATEKGAVKGGFERKSFIEKNENTFDKKFSYQREKQESFNYSLNQSKSMKTDHSQKKANQSAKSKLTDLDKQLKVAANYAKSLEKGASKEIDNILSGGNANKKTNKGFEI
jgi:hypothetical protein